MRRKLLIILAFLPLFLNGQNGLGKYNSGIWSYQGGAVSYPHYPNARGNTVGVIPVTAPTYSTNDDATTITVGATGDYANLNLAYGAASSGDVIEIIDDESTLIGQLSLSKAADGGGKAIKIKGKSTKSTLNLFNTTYPIRNTADAAIEFENIIFNEDNSHEPLVLFAYGTSGFCHLINCEFDGGQHVNFNSIMDIVLDGVTFTNQVDTEVIVMVNTILSGYSSAILNNITCDYSAIGNFLFYSKSTGDDLSYLSLTNSDIYIESSLFTGITYAVDTIDIKGNLIGLKDGAGIVVGLEASGGDIAGIPAYVAETSYTVGDSVDYEANLWECTQNTTGNAPGKTSAYWDVAEWVIGSIENNTLYRTTYSAAGHGLFLGFGTYEFSVKNNIINNYWYNYVIKGVNNTIQYNCAGEGLRGFSIFANNQAIISNNTSRTEDDYGMQVNAQTAGGTGVDSTVIRDNILTTVPTADEVIIFKNSTGNTYSQNIVYGDGPLINYNTVQYDASVPSELNTYKSLSGDSKAQFLNPEWSGSDPLTELYYLPTNLNVVTLRDTVYQSVGAIDVVKYR